LRRSYKEGKVVVWSKTFSGGTHLSYHKEETAQKPIRKAQEPKRVIIPLFQHTGAPACALVKVGDSVKMGQKIGEARGFISAPVHSSIAGRVVAIQPSPHPLGRSSLSIIIENDGTNLLDENIKPRSNLSTLTSDEIKVVIREAGIVGMGGAAFPTHVKLSPPSKSKIDTFILNCAECEPYLTCDYRLLLERAEEVIYGMKALMKALGVRKGYIGIEDNKPEVIELLRKIQEKDKNSSYLQGLDKGKEIKVIVLETKYPQGAEKQLIKAILNREVPLGGLPLDIGAVVNNVGTAFAVAQAIKKGLPLIKRIVTIAGSGVVSPQNLEVKLGTTFADVIEQCGGFTDATEKVIMGGPMMGIAQYTLDVPVIKGTSGILLLSKPRPYTYARLVRGWGKPEVGTEQTHPCIKCARCVDSCPINLLPLYLGTYGEKELWRRCEELGVLDCIECGCCAYICPARRPLIQIIKLAKQEVSAYKAKSQEQRAKG
jgi:electron transport complex protein RnfC